MKHRFYSTKTGLVLVLSGLLFGILTGIAFGISESFFKEFISQGIHLHPALHDSESASKIWRYALRAHFHETGISAICLGLVILITISNMSHIYKRISSISVALGIFYPLSWFNMFLIAPSIGRHAAHEDIITQLFIYIGVGGLLIGISIITLHILTGRLGHNQT